MRSPLLETGVASIGLDDNATLGPVEATSGAVALVSTTVYGRNDGVVAIKMIDPEGGKDNLVMGSATSSLTGRRPVGAAIARDALVVAFPDQDAWTIDLSDHEHPVRIDSGAAIGTVTVVAGGGDYVLAGSGDTMRLFDMTGRMPEAVDRVVAPGRATAACLADDSAFLAYESFSGPVPEWGLVAMSLSGGRLGEIGRTRLPAAVADLACSWRTAYAASPAGGVLAIVVERESESSYLPVSMTGSNPWAFTTRQAPPDSLSAP
jgi:hypothetical protein